MPSPYQYPWVNFDLEPTANIGSTPELIFGKTHTSILDSIVLCNNTDQDIFVDIQLLCERNEIAIPVNRYRNVLITKFGTVQLLEESMIMRAGDLMYANSDFQDHRFDSMISFRELLETA